MYIKRLIALIIFLPCIIYGEVYQSKNGIFILPFYGGFSITNHNLIGDTKKVRPLVGVSFGAGIEYIASPKFSIGIDFLLTSKGYELEDTNLTRHTISYIDIPIKLKYWPFYFLNIYAGPYLTSFLTGAISESAGQSENVKTSYGNDFGMVGGIWFGFPFSKKFSAGIDIRYEAGLSDIQNDAFPETSLKTRTIIILLSIVFKP